MKTAVSIPDPIFRMAEQAAKRMKLSRSSLYAKALAEFTERHRSKGVREALDLVYGTESSSLDSALQQMQARSLAKENW